MGENANNIVIESATIIFRNFAGKESRFNPEGHRNFGVLLNHDEAASLSQAGWNVKMLHPRNEGDEPQPWLPVSVSFDFYPPKVWIITSMGKTQLDESTVGQLDWAEIETADVVLRPYNWEVNGKTGVKAYLKAAYITIAEDEFAKKYNIGIGSGDTPDLPFD